MGNLSRREFLRAVLVGAGALFAYRTSSEIEKTGRAVSDLLEDYNAPLEQVVSRVLEEKSAGQGSCAKHELFF